MPQKTVSFEVISKKTIGKIVIAKHTQYNNIDADIVILEENITARLFGKIRKSLVLKEGSCLYMHGVIYGNVKNQGGQLQLYPH